MIAVSVASVTAGSKVGGLPASAWPRVSVPSIGDSAAGSAVIMKKCSASESWNPAYPSAPMARSAVPWKQKYAFTSAVGQVVGDLATLEQHVERHHDGAGLEDPVVDDREVGQVGAAQRHLLAGLDAALHEQVRDLVGGGVDLCVGQAGVTEHQRIAVGIAAGGVLEQDGEIQHGHNLLTGWPCVTGSPAGGQRA